MKDFFPTRSGPQSNARLGRQAISCEQAGSLFDPCPMPCLILQQYRIVYANPAALDALGASVPEQVVGHALMEFVHPDFRRAVLTRMDEVLGTGSPGCAVEKKFLRLDGAAFPVEVNTWGILLTTGEAVQTTFTDLTRRQVADSALRISEERFRKTFEHAHVGMALIGTDYQFLRVNAAFCEMLGYSKDELTRMSFVEVTHPDDLDADCARTNDLFDGEGESYGTEKRYIARDGRSFWVRMTRSVVRDATGAPLHALAVIEDVDSRKRAEERLKESEERLRLSMAGAQIGTFDWDIAKGTLTWSENLRQMIGVKAEDDPLDFAFFWNLVHPDDRELLQRAVQNGIDTGHYECDFRMIRPDGAIRWVAARATVYYDTQGKPVRALGVDIEITQRKQMEEALRTRDLEVLEAVRRSEMDARSRADELSAILKSVPALTFIAHDPDCHRMTSSVAAHEVLRVPVGGNASKSAPDGERLQFRIMRGDEEIPADELPVQVAARTGREVRNAELTLEFADGSRCEIYGHAVPLFDEDGHTRGAVGAFVDITERKRAEERLRLVTERFQVALKESTIVVFNQDLQLRYTWIYNPALGYDPTDVIGKRDTDLFERAEDAAVTESMKAEVIQTGVGQRREVLIHSDGLDRFYDLQVDPLYDHQGRIAGVTCAAVDITQRKRSEEALRTSEARFRNIFENAATGIAITDLSKRHIRTNPAYNAIVGYTEEELSHQDLPALLHPDDRQKNLDLLEQLRRGEISNYSVENRYLRKDGSPVWVQKYVSLLGGLEDSPGGLVVLVTDISKRKADEEAVRRSEERLRLAAQTAGFGVHDYDPQTDRSVWSEHLYEIAGMRVGEEIRIDRVISLTHPEDRARVADAIRSALDPKGDGLFAEEFRICRADTGETRWIYNRAQTVFVGDGAERKPVRSTGVVLDITDRRNAEFALRDSERLYRAMFNTAAVGIANVGLDGRWLRVNNAVCAITGYSREELFATTFAEITHPDDLEADWQRVRDLVAGNTPSYAMEKRYIRKDGSIVWVDLTVSLLRDEAGHPQYMVSVIQDISDQKSAQAALRESEERFKTLADNISQLAWMADANGWIFWFNQRWYDYTGADLQETQGWRWQKLHHPDHVQRVTAKIRACFESGEDWEDTFPLRGKDGHYRWFLSRAIPLRDAEGRVFRWFGTNTDITEQRLAEETLRRTEKLSAVGRMALNISHEINNPLAAVMNLLYLIAADEALATTTREFVVSAERELRRVSHVVTQTLRFAKPSERADRVDLGEIADSILDLFQGRFESTGIVVVRAYGTNITLNGYADELRQLVANLVSNAHDAMRSGGRLIVRIRQARSWSATEGRGVRFTIADNGMGIPAPMKVRIFEPFVTTKQDTGTGLGLWISSKIVEKHHGHIFLRSSTDPRHHGSVFSLFFPAE